jgi:DNA polymerase-1
MTKKLLLIDGSSMLVTSFYGNVNVPYMKTGDTSKLMQTKDGLFTNGVYTMCKVLLNLIQKQKPTHIAVAWDVNRESLVRREKYEAYKANRSETKSELGEQFGTMQQTLKAMNIPSFKLISHEADDIIGTFAKKFENEIPTYIITKDQDALQLISENTRVWLGTSKAKDLYSERGIDTKTLNIPDGFFEYTVLTFEEEYGLKPIQMVDKKAIEGDSSDNIPGVKGVGPTAVVPLLQEYGTLEKLYEVLESEEEEELKQFFKDSLGIKRSPIKNLLEQRDSAFLSKQLATIDCDLPGYDELTLENLELSLDIEGTKAKFMELEFKSLLEKL